MICQTACTECSKTLLCTRSPWLACTIDFKHLAAMLQLRCICASALEDVTGCSLGCWLFHDLLSAALQLVAMTARHAHVNVCSVDEC